MNILRNSFTFASIKYPKKYTEKIPLPQFTYNLQQGILLFAYNASFNIAFARYVW